MKIFRRALTLAALSCAFVVPAAARADVLADTTADVHVSTLGYAVAVGRTIAPHVDVRISTGTLTYNHAYSADNLNYMGSIRLQNVAALVDVRPFTSAFRLTGGIVVGNDNIDTVATPSQSGTFVIGGNTYTSAQVGALHGIAKFGSAAPYLGFGTGTPHRLGVSVTADAGVVFRSVSTTVEATGPINGSAQFQSDLTKARAEFANSTSFLKTYPVLSLGIAARF